MEMILNVTAVAVLCAQAEGTVEFTEPSGKYPLLLIDEEGLAPVRGVASEPIDKVVLKFCGKRVDVPLQDGKWYARISVPEGPARIQIEKGPFLDVWATRRDQIRKRGCLRVSFEWDPGVDKRLDELAKKTLHKPPSGDDLEAFIEAVKTETLVFYFGQAFAGVNVQPFEAASPNEGNWDHHKVTMHATGGNSFGGAMWDCWNESEDNLSNVYLEVVEKLLAQAFENKQMPMRGTDSWEVRAQDIAYFLARTAAHETGHALGLVAMGTDAKCAWMGGVNDKHHHGVEGKKQPDRRFGRGKYIMDDGKSSPYKLRIGEPRKRSRLKPGERLPLQFCAFDIAYLRLLYPLD